MAAFLLPGGLGFSTSCSSFSFIDVGFAQNVMFCAAPPDWGILLPGDGAVRVLVDASFTSTFDFGLPASYLAAAVWLAALRGSRRGWFRRVTEPRIG
ncbi:MAG: hypothetical protein IH818_11555 [Acidobacteria bacterium]|nr:hypothetical protein [Acidobacteriota bacterium]